MYMSCCTMRERADRSLRLPLSYSSINKKWSNVLEGRMNNTSSNDLVAHKLGERVAQRKCMIEESMFIKELTKR